MMSTFVFKKAQRSRAKLKLALTGPSGSGKTFSALRLAKGIGGKVAFLDTENHSASLYSEQFDFDEITLDPPFATERYIGAINAAVTGGYDILIIDSLTHAWAGPGGLLEQKEGLDSRGGRQNQFTNWNAITKKHEAFKAAILHAPIHIIGTMRSKQEHAQSEENGKKIVKKLGLGPIQREGMEYEFTIVFDIAMNHEAEASKDRTGLFSTTDRQYFKITEQTGAEIAQWLGKGISIDVSHAENKANTPEHRVTPAVSHSFSMPAPTVQKVIEKAALGGPAKQSDPSTWPSGYVIQFGKFNSLTLSGIPLNELLAYVRYLETRANNEGKAITGSVKEMIEQVKKLSDGVPF